MNLRPKLTYANVVATVALVLAIGGGTVYAAAQLGKNDVRSRNIARGAVKNADLGKNAVTTKKIKNRTIKAADLAKGLLANDVADVTGSASGGPQGSINTATTSPLPLKGTVTFTPKPGQVSALVAEGQFTIATATPGQFCQPAAFLLVNGQRTRVFVEPDDTGGSTTPVTSTGHDADGPFGLLSPGAPITVSAQLEGDADCTAGSRLDRLEVRIIQID
jgi:hypothetical protein